MSSLKRWAEALFRIEESPHRIALAFGVGVWIAFCPAFGIHTVMALAIAYRFRLSRAALLLGAYLNNPWTVAPMYMAGTALGCLLLGVPTHAVSSVDWNLEGVAFYRALGDEVRPFLMPFVIGNTLLGIISGMAAYVAVRTAVERRRVLQANP